MKTKKSTRSPGSSVDPVPEHASVKSKAMPVPRPHPARNGAWGWHHRVLLALRDRLRLAQGGQFRDITEPLEPHSMDLADSATDEFDHDLLLSHLSAEQDALREVDEALRRIDAGTYGICEESGQPIPAGRLRAIPWTRFSREAQMRREERNAAPREHLGAVSSLRESPGVAFDEAEAEAGEEKEIPPGDEALAEIKVPLPRGRQSGAR